MIAAHAVGALCSVAVLLFAGRAGAQAVRPNAGFLANGLGPTDDGSTGAVPLGFTVSYFGGNYTKVYVNNNGYVAFDEEVTTLFTASRLDQRLLAVFFADVDTRGAASGTMHYGMDTVDGRPAFGATWSAVGYYQRYDDKLDTFQIVLIERADTGAGHFDVEYNYETIEWECGERSDGGAGGVGGWPSAIVGYSDGANHTLLPGSGTPGSFLDSNSATGLVHSQNQSNVLGRYLFEFRQSIVVDAGAPRDGGHLVDAALASRDAIDPVSPNSAPISPGCACEVTTAQTHSWFSIWAFPISATALALRRRRTTPRLSGTRH
jgi:hypothetical protein